MKAAAGISQDAGYSYIWHDMDRDDRAVVCMLADISTEASWCEWAQLPTVERVALRSAMSAIIADHWERQKKKHHAAHSLADMPQAVA